MEDFIIFGANPYPMSYILKNVENGVCTLSMNRPDKFNSFVREMAFDLQDKLEECASDEEIRCVVLTGIGKAFCAGQDLAEATDPNGPELTKIVSEHYNPIVQLIRKIEKPVIAAVNGVAAGAGANLALACDIVIATESASFIQAFSKIGLIPDSGGTFFLPRLVGWQRASALMMTGEKVMAKEAVEMGMIYKSVPNEEFEATVTGLAQQMAQMPTKGLGLTKRALNQSFGNSLQQQLDLEDELQSQAGRTNDYAEGTSAFLEKRKPVFKGN